MTAVPVQPQAFVGLQLQVIELSPGYRTRTAFTIQHQGMHQPHCALSSSNILTPKLVARAYSGICSGLGEMITPLLSA